MANSFSYQVITNTNKRTVIKLTGQLDANGVTSNTVIQGRLLPGALAQDTNNAVLVSNPSNSAFNGVARTNYNYAIARINYDVWMPTGYITLNWDGATPAPIACLGGAYDLDVQDNLGIIFNNAISPNGNITLSTSGATANSSYTILVEIHKGGNQANAACDFDMGQVAKASDFNFPPFNVKP